MLILCLIKPEYAEYIWSFVELSYAKNSGVGYLLVNRCDHFHLKYHIIPFDISWFPNGEAAHMNINVKKHTGWYASHSALYFALSILPSINV